MNNNVGIPWSTYLAIRTGFNQSSECVWHFIGETRLVREGSSRKRWVTYSRCGAELFFLYEVTSIDWVSGRWCKRCEQRATDVMNMMAWTGAIG